MLPLKTHKFPFFYFSSTEIFYRCCYWIFSPFIIFSLLLFVLSNLLNYFLITRVPLYGDVQFLVVAGNKFEEKQTWVKNQQNIS